MKDWIDRQLSAWATWTHRHPWLILAVVGAIVGAMALTLPRIELDTSTEGFLLEDNPLRVAYDEFRAQFGRDDQIVIAIETSNVFEIDFLAALRSLHEDVENEVPYVEEVSSLINARNTRGEGDRLIVGELLESPPADAVELAEIERIVRANPMYQNLLVSDDARFAMVLIRISAYSSIGADPDALAGFEESIPEAGGGSTDRPFLTGAENTEVVEALESIVDRHSADGFRIYMAGSPTMIEAMQRAMLSDMVRFTSLAVLVIVISLALLFRRIAGVVLPVLTVLLSLIVTMAIMSISGTPITVPTQILPSFLLAVGVGYSVHVLVIFYQRRREGSDQTQAISYALGHSGLAIIMTSLTTAGGLVSFAAGDMAPIADFGIFAPIGVIIALLFTLILLPALTAVFPMGAARAREGGSADRLSQRVLVRIGNFANDRAPFVATAAAGILAISLLGAFQLSFSHDPMTWFPEDNFYRISNDIVNEKLKGSMFVEALVDTHQENGLHDPALLAKLDEIRRRSMALSVNEIAVGKTFSLVEVVKETNQALHENNSDYYTIPNDRSLVAQELLLFENSGSDDLEDLVDSRFSQARMTIKVSMADAIHYESFIERLDGIFRETLGEDADFSFTGLMVILGGTMNAMIRSMAKAYVIALAIITPMLILLIGNFRMGLIAMIPNLTPIIITLGLMGWIGIPIDAFTLLIGSIAIGLAVDDTIHFMHHFRSNFEETGDVRESTQRTLRSTGQALLYTSVVLSAGFFIYTFASMKNLLNFGFLTGLTIIFAFLADMILAPALLALTVRPAKTRAPNTELPRPENPERADEMEVFT